MIYAWSFGICLLMATLPPLVAHHYWRELFPGDVAAFRRFIGWTAKGLFLPILVWFLINAGWFPGVPILSREIALLKSGGAPWFSRLIGYSGPPLLVAAYTWGAVSIGWLLAEAWERTSDRGDFRNQSALVSLPLVPVAAWIVWSGGWPWVGPAVFLWLVPVLHLSLPMARRRDPLPFYSGALARMKFGKYREAELEVIRQLERREDDFEGWMMLAEIYATKFHDLPEADLTVRQLCLQPNLNPVQISIALNRLADWHLRLGQDPQSARETLEELCRRFPGTHAERMARQRIAQLPADRQELLDRGKPRRVRLPALGDALDEPATPALDPRDAQREAERCVECLKRDPDNIEARERFASLLAEPLGKVDLALEQLELLAGMEGVAESKRAEWLATMAAWQLRLRHDPDAGRALLQRIIREFPRTPQAMAARRRLELMETEEAPSQSGGPSSTRP